LRLRAENNVAHQAAKIQSHCFSLRQKYRAVQEQSGKERQSVASSTVKVPAVPNSYQATTESADSLQLAQRFQFV
jgi:hypothetical protein